MFKLAKTISLVFLLVFPSFGFADELGKALSATEAGNYTKALPIWMELAHSENPVAQYNLGLFYQRGLGVSKNEREARRWFGFAAQKGLIQAYTQLNSAVVKPGPHTIAPDTLDPQQWVIKQPPEFYTLQLASSRNHNLIKKYYVENHLQGKAGYYRSSREGQEWYALVYGAFPSVSDANAHISDLPVELRKWSPWVRNIKDIHAVMLKGNER